MQINVGPANHSFSITSLVCHQPQKWSGGGSGGKRPSWLPCRVPRGRASLWHPSVRTARSIPGSWTGRLFQNRRERCFSSSGRRCPRLWRSDRGTRTRWGPPRDGTGSSSRSGCVRSRHWQGRKTSSRSFWLFKMKMSDRLYRQKNISNDEMVHLSIISWTKSEMRLTGKSMRELLANLKQLLDCQFQILMVWSSEQLSTHGCSWRWSNENYQKIKSTQ